MQIDDEKFKLVKNDIKNYYYGIDKIYCPYLKTQVHFSSEGFNHLLSKSWNRGRSKIEQYTRLKFLPLAVQIIKLSHTLQEFDERKIFVRQIINSRWEKRLKLVRYYIFIALVKEKGVRLKIVIKEIENGEPFFWSLYPSWRIKTNTNGSKRKVFYAGNLEED